jgi:hypothetical protein
MPSAATKAKRAAAKAEKDAEKAVLEARLNAAVVRMEVQSTIIASAEQLPPPPLPLPPAASSANDDMPLVPTKSSAPASPPQKKPKTDVAEPIRSELTPRGGNVNLFLQAETPGGTVFEESFKRVAAAPVGEVAEARRTRLAKERQRLHRARERLTAQLQHRQDALSLAVVEFDAAVGKDVDVEELTISLQRLNPLMETASEQKRWRALEAATLACSLELATIIDDQLTVQDVYAMYPSEERPQYSLSQYGIRMGPEDSHSRRRPDESRCACGNSLRYECATDCKPLHVRVHQGSPVVQKHGCESDPFALIVSLEHEQNGEVPKWPGDCYDRCHRCNQRMPIPGGSWRGCLETCTDGLTHDLSCKWHQKTLQVADRLCRWSPGILRGSNSRRAMALYRRVTPQNLINAYSILHCEDIVLPQGQPTIERWLVPF